MKLNEMVFQGIVILEPVGSLTDFITGITGIVVAYLIWKKKSPETSMQLFFMYFLFTGMATVCAGTIGHAFLYYLSPEWKMVGWSLSALGLFFFERASIVFFKKNISPKAFKVLNYLTLIQLGIFYILLIIPFTRSFKIVQLNATFCYAGIILPLYVHSIIRWKFIKSWYVIFGIAFAALIAYVYNTEVTIHKWFNHHSLTHVLMTCFVLYMYFTVLQLHTKSKPEEISKPIIEVHN